jgi:riboflavin synthase, alpha subunit
MFTGIITDVGTIKAIEQRGDLRVRISTAYDTTGVDIGASIACSGACLTVVQKGDGWFAVDISEESVTRTAPGRWVLGQRLNLERALKVGDELGGHIVTGHVDGIGEIVSVEPVGDSNRITIAAGPEVATYIAAKGSITLDGISLTVNEVADVNGSVQFTINVIPHTAQVTTFDTLKIGQHLNIEIDILARYLGRMQNRITQ